MAEPRQLFLQCLEILDDAVMDDGDPVGGDRVGVLLVRLAVRRPARMADADRPPHRFAFEAGDEVRQFAFGAAPLDPAIDQGRDARRIIATVFEPPEAFDQLWRDRFLGDDPNDAAHQRFFPRSLSRNSAARPGLSTCRARAIVSPSAGTSWITTLPVAI